MRRSLRRFTAPQSVVIVSRVQRQTRCRRRLTSTVDRPTARPSPRRRRAHATSPPSLISPLSTPAYHADRHVHFTLHYHSSLRRCLSSIHAIVYHATPFVILTSHHYHARHYAVISREHAPPRETHHYLRRPLISRHAVSYHHLICRRRAHEYSLFAFVCHA